MVCCLVPQLCPTLYDPPHRYPPPTMVNRQAPLSMEFPRQEYWHGSSFPTPGDLLEPGIEPPSPALAGEFFTTVPPGKCWVTCRGHLLWRAISLSLTLELEAPGQGVGTDLRQPGARMHWNPQAQVHVEQSNLSSLRWCTKKGT